MIKLFKNQSGFTLLELLVASAIAALLAVMSYEAIDQAVRLKTRADEQAQRQRAIERALWKLSVDLYQLAPRPVRDEYGQLRPALQWDGRTLRFTRLATGAQPSPETGVQRVMYQLEAGALVRVRWDCPDRTTDTPAQRLVLLQGVRDWSVQLVDERRAFQLDWPPLTPQGRLALTALPRAVRVRLTLADGTVLTRWISGVDTLAEAP